MIHQSSLSGEILIVGAPDILAVCQSKPISLQISTVGASAPTLHDLAGSASDIVAQHEVVLFETDVSDADLDALAVFVEAAQGRTKFVALVDENLPLAKARMLNASGATDVLPLEMTAKVFAQALTEVTQAPKDKVAPSTPAGPKAKIISVAQSRGGAGATTVAVNLAASLAKPAKRRDPAARVLLLDFDLQFGNAGTYLDVEDNGAFCDLITEGTLPNADAIMRAVQTSSHGVDVLTAPVVFVPLTSMSIEFVAHMIGVFQDAYDYLVIDLPRATMDWLTPIIMATDRLVMVSDGSVPCIRQAKRLIDLYRENQINLAVDLVMNREKKLLFGSDTVRDAEALLDLKVRAWVPDDPAGERRAIDLGRPTALARSKGRKTYRKLAKSLAIATNATTNSSVKGT